MQALDVTPRPCSDTRRVATLARPQLPWLARTLLTRGPVGDFYRRVQQNQAGRPFFRAIIDTLGTTYTSDTSTLARIPRSGAVVMVANHPFGILEGAMLADLVGRVRSDVRVLTNHMLCQAIPELLDFCIPIDPFGGLAARRHNHRGLGEALTWLQGGGVLVVFPAGEVSHWQAGQRCVTDPRWHTTAAKLLQKTGAHALPVFVDGQNSRIFHALGVLHPRLRTLRLPSELLNKAGIHIDLRIGHARPVAQDALQNNTRGLTEHLRACCYALGERRPAQASAKPQGTIYPLVHGAPAEQVVSELAALSPRQLMHEDNDFCVYVTRGTHIPYTMRELGRAREATFRAVGEGTGKGLDLDAFDAYYEHFILWHKADRRLAGAYRLTDVQSIRRHHARDALYTQTLFDYTPAFFAALGPALELGRSFVVQAYQKHYGALLALWKAVARYVAMRPQTPVLIGAVSISRDYTPVSRDLMVRFLRDHAVRPDLAGEVRPRNPFVEPRVGGWSPHALSRGLRDVEALSQMVSDIEPDGKGLPVLLRKYLKLGGRVVGFNVDREFCDVLDALVVVDLRETDRRLLSRFMGPADLQQFLTHHAA